MACEFCEQKGYITISQLGHNKEYIQVKVCPKCEDLKAYSDYIKQKYSRSPQFLQKTHPVNPNQNGDVFLVPPTINDVNDNILDLEEFRKRRKPKT